MEHMDGSMAILPELLSHRLSEAGRSGRAIRPRELAQVIRSDLRAAGGDGALSTERIRQALEHMFIHGKIPGYEAVLVDAYPNEYCYLPEGASYERMALVAQAGPDAQALEEGDTFEHLGGTLA